MSQNESEFQKTKKEEAEQFLVDKKQEGEQKEQKRQPTAAEVAKMRQSMEKQRKEMIKSYKTENDLLEEQVRHMSLMLEHNELTPKFNKLMEEKAKEREYDGQGEE